jgi:hypothetical protein
LKKKKYGREATQMNFSHIYFVYLNKNKQTAIANYHTNKTNNLNTNIDAINNTEVLHAIALPFAQTRKA